MGILCGAGDSQKYGSFCRLCYTDQKAALQAEAGFRRSEEAFAWKGYAELTRPDTFSAEDTNDAELRRSNAFRAEYGEAGFRRPDKAFAGETYVESRRSDAFSAGDADNEELGRSEEAFADVSYTARSEAFFAEDGGAELAMSQAFSVEDGDAELRRLEEAFARDGDTELRRLEAGSAEDIGEAGLTRLEAFSAEDADDAELRRSETYSAGDGDARHVIMCDTMRPPSALECSPQCAGKKDTVRIVPEK